MATALEFVLEHELELELEHVLEPQSADGYCPRICTRT